MHNHKKAITGYADTFNHGACLDLTYLAPLRNNRLYFLSRVGPVLSLIKCELKYQSNLSLCVY